MAASTNSNVFSVAATVFLALYLLPSLALGQFLTPAETSLPPLRPQPSSNFVLNGLVGQPPQTRYFYFDVGQVQGSPDGVSRPMLVVNGICPFPSSLSISSLTDATHVLGMYPGPGIEANQHDRLVIYVKNSLPTSTSIHWHGLVSLFPLLCLPTRGS